MGEKKKHGILTERHVSCFVGYPRILQKAYFLFAEGYKAYIITWLPASHMNVVVHFLKGSLSFSHKWEKCNVVIAIRCAIAVTVKKDMHGL